MDQAQNYLEKSIFNVFDKIKDKKFNKINYFNLFVKKIEKNKFNVYFSKILKKNMITFLLCWLYRFNPHCRKF